MTAARCCAHRVARKSSAISVCLIISRADVLNMLIGAMPPRRIHLGHRLVSFSEHSDKVEAQFENGARVSVDALIGADGIHSTVQRLLFGATPPHLPGCAAYPGLVPAEKVAHLH